MNVSGNHAQVPSWFRKALLSWQILIFLALAVGCSSTSDPVPKPEDLTFQYFPQSAVIDFFPGDTASFSLTSSPVVPLAFTWNLNGELAGHDAVFHFDAARVGVDTLRLDYTYQSVTWTRNWFADVQANPSTAPLAIPWVTLEHGPNPGDVLVGWHAIPESTFPLQEYQVRVSYEEEITEDSWLDATVLGVFPVEGNQAGYSELFSSAEHDLPPGEDAWFAVRGVDTVGQLSPLAGDQYHLISLPWYIEGYVYSNLLEPLPEVIVSYGCPSCRVNTDATGFFSIGPLPNVNTYDLSTHSYGELWYDFDVRDVQYDPLQTNDIMIMARHELDESCTPFDGEFLSFFRFMTLTANPSFLRPDYKLYKWEEYPVPVYVPPYISEYGLDLQSLCREAVGFVNLAMGEEYLLLVDTPEESRIELYFGNEGIQYAGRVYLTEPSDHSYHLGDVIPEKMRLYIWDQLDDSQDVQETAMHELGHTLGLYSHALCDNGTFLMAVNSSGILDNGPENALHPNEKQAIATIRNLPQGTDMQDFH